jgi:hypothetical protein
MDCTVSKEFTDFVQTDEYREKIIHDVARKLQEIGDDIDQEYSEIRLNFLVFLENRLSDAVFGDLKQKWMFLRSFVRG